MFINIQILIYILPGLLLTWSTELKALPASQLLVQDTSQDSGQQQDRSAHGWVVRGD